MSYILEFKLYEGPRAVPLKRVGPWRRVNKRFGTRTAALAASGSLTSLHRDLAVVRARKVAR